MKYKGIELEGLDKDVKLAHSRFTEADEVTGEYVSPEADE